MVAGAVCVAVIRARIVWVTGAAAFSRWRCRPRADGTPGPLGAVALTARGAAVVGWCGMRGTVTLAAALALPTGGEGGVPFPYQDLIRATAFGVVLGTLVLQGLTLRPLLLRLRLEDDGAVDREVRLARVEPLRAAVEAAAACPGAETAELVRHRYELQLRRAEEKFAGNGASLRNARPGDSAATPATTAGTDGREADAAAVRAATEAQRRLWRTGRGGSRATTETGR
ncbi:MAG: cation:proton antiporter [Thermoanaerobaculia bacterium]